MVQHNTSAEYVVVYPYEVRNVGIQYDPHPFLPQGQGMLLLVQTAGG